MRCSPLLALVTILALPTAALAQTVEVSAPSGLNIRSGPGIEHKVVYVAPNASILQPSEARRGKWIKVAFGYVSGWVHSDYVIEPGSATSGGEGENTTRMLAVVTASALNFRTGPGTQFSKLGQLERTALIEVLGRSGNWTKVRVDNRVAWVHSSYIGDPSGGSSGASSGGSSPAPSGGGVSLPGSPAPVGNVAGGEQTLNLIKRFEGYRSNAYWDVNAYRVGYGSDTYQTADGRVHRVQRSTVIARADAERDIARRAAEFQNTIRQQVGASVFNGLSPNVQAALTSVAYNYGSLPSSVRNAAASGSVSAIANAVERLSANKSRRAVEAAAIRGQ